MTDDDIRGAPADGRPHPGYSLASKLDYLFRQVHPRGRGEFSYREVAAGIERAGGPTVSASYLMYLRKGERTNPSLQHLEALAAFFGVPAAYFLDDATTADVVRQLDLLGVLRDAGVQSVALRMAELSPDGIAAVTRMVEEIRQAESSGQDDTAAGHDDEGRRS